MPTNEPAPAVAAARGGAGKADEGFRPVDESNTADDWREAQLRELDASHADASYVVASQVEADMLEPIVTAVSRNDPLLRFGIVPEGTGSHVILLGHVDDLPADMAETIETIERVQIPPDRTLPGIIGWPGRPMNAEETLSARCRFLEWMRSAGRSGCESSIEDGSRVAAEREASKPKARVRSYAEFQQQPDFEFRMVGWLPSKGVAVLGGAEHTGKSILAVDWAHRCVFGEAVADWLGHPVRETCSSLYIIGEDAQGVMLRSQAFVRERVAGELGEQWLGTGYYEGRTIEFVDRMPAPLAEPVGIDEVRRLVRDFGRRNGHMPGIVWLDTSSTLYGGEENDNAGMGQFAKALGEVADELDVLVVLIHHLRKPSTMNGIAAKPTSKELRGAGAMAGDFDVVMLVWRPKPDDQLSPVEVFVAKGKNGGTTGAAHTLASEWVSLRRNRHGDDVGAPVLVPAPPPRLLSEADRHEQQLDNVQRIAHRMMAALRADDHPGWVQNQTAAEALTHGKGKDKRQAWRWLEQRGWVANIGSERKPRWALTGDAPPSLEGVGGGADAP